MSGQARLLSGSFGGQEVAWSADQRRGAIVVFAIWYVFACFFSLSLAAGGDLAPLVIGARFAAEGHDALLYVRSLGYLTVDHAAWTAEAERIRYTGTIYPYLYPPLVAHLFVPLAHINFWVLVIVSAVAETTAIAAALVLAAWHWNRAWLRPATLLMLLGGVSFSIAFISGALATNVQGGVILLTVLAMVWSQRGRPLLAGCALGIAAFVKILPGVVAIYWLLSGRRDSAAWFAAVLAGLGLLSIAVCGLEPNIAYVENFRDLSNSLVPIWSNKGLPNLLYGLGNTIDISDTFRLVAIPSWVSTVNLIAMLAGLAFVLRDARRFRDMPRADAAGMAAVLLIVTITSPIAWTHYYRFLVIAVLIWGGLRSGGTSRWLLPVLAAVLTSVFYRWASELLASHGLPDWLVGGELIAGLAVLAGLMIARRGSRFAIPDVTPRLLAGAGAAQRAL